MSLIIIVKRPLLGSILLILISILIRLIISTLTSKWISYLIILLFLGGMIVLFVYICSLITGIKTFLKRSYNTPLFSTLVLVRIFSFFYCQYWDLRLRGKYIFISRIYLKSNFILMLLCIVYLLLVLLIRIKLSQKFKGGLKSKIYDF